jgi:serine/threonine-protein kinase
MVASGVAAVLLIGGAGLSYASREAPPTLLGEAGPEPSASTIFGAPGEPPAALPPGTVTPTPSATPSATASPTSTPSRTPPVSTPSRTPTRTPAPVVSTTPPPPKDTKAPTVGEVSVSPAAIEPGGCPYGPTASTVTATVADDTTPVASLRVSFRYVLDGETRTVGMAFSRAGTFRGTLGDLPAPKTDIRIPVSVTVSDAAGNASTAGPTEYVSLASSCSPG